MGKIIDSIQLPEGLRTLSALELKQVCEELRDELIDCVACSGGHFASSLGAVELSVVLHALFNSPTDRIVWDTGHQAYIHKMLTGRRDKLPTIRKTGGLSGFLKRSESKHDIFGAGHAGTSISAAVGMSAAQQQHPSPSYVVPVIGDGAITAGMAFEALNHAGAMGLRNFIVVLNDNEMSISENVGALSWLFSRTVTSKASTLARSSFKNLYRRGYVPELVYQVMDRVEDLTQGFFAGAALLFESFGFRYMGPINGHDVDALLTAFNNAKQQDVPVLMHCYTTKGKGYEPAEADPIKWHGVTPFQRSEGQFVASAPAKPPPSYTSVFSQALIDLMQRDERIRAITAAMPTGTGIDRVQSAFPQRCFDVGICEQHAVTFSAGMACEGLLPVCAIYSTFMQRGFDQIVHDVCIQKLPVVLAMDRGGVVGNDGETHQGVFDIAFLRSLPHITLMSPRDEQEFRDMLYTATIAGGPVAIRYPRGNGVGIELRSEFTALPIGKAEIVREGSDGALICYGPMVQTGVQVAELLSANGRGEFCVVNARFAKPLDEELLTALLPRMPIAATIEDHALLGGFGSAVLEFINDRGVELLQPLLRFGVQDEFVPHASQGEQQRANGYDVASIVSALAQQMDSATLLNSQRVALLSA